MGTDIHMVVERRINGKWETFTKKIFTGWDGENLNGKTCVPYDTRNYNVFSILANVRNGYGFAGCRIGEKFNPISEPKGYPDDMDSRSLKYLSEEHSASYLTLKEIFDFDWNQLHRDYGLLSEEEYKTTIMKGNVPDSWSGGIYGFDVKIISETDMVDLIQGIYPRVDSVQYYTGCYFNPVPYKESAQYFLESMEKLKEYIPKNGGLEDVRIVFDFDS